MKSKSLKTIALIVASLIGFSLICSTPTFAVSSSSSSSSSTDTTADPCGENVPDAVKKANGCEHSSSDQLPIVISNILNGIIIVSGLVAVVFVIVGGANYMSSSGDANKLQKARNTILYALIGMVICVLAYAIVNFVIINLIGSGQ